MKQNALLSTSPMISPQKTPRKSPRRLVTESKIPLSSPSSPTSKTLRAIHKDANTKQVDEFVPEPPLETQFKELGRTFEKIKDFFNVDDKDNISTSSISRNIRPKEKKARVPLQPQTNINVSTAEPPKVNDGEKKKNRFIKYSDYCWDTK